MSLMGQRVVAAGILEGATVREVSERGHLERGEEVNGGNCEQTSRLLNHQLAQTVQALDRKHLDACLREVA